MELRFPLAMKFKPRFIKNIVIALKVAQINLQFASKFTKIAGKLDFFKLSLSILPDHFEVEL
jgi:hypothetical protein